MKMLKERLAGEYVSQSLSVTTPPLNFIQNAGFEKVNRNSAKNRSRWLWWGGWSWGGDYENAWEDRPEYVHSGEFPHASSASARPVGSASPRHPLPAVAGATGYELTSGLAARGTTGCSSTLNRGPGATSANRYRRSGRNTRLSERRRRTRTRTTSSLLRDRRGNDLVGRRQARAVGGNLEE